MKEPEFFAPSRRITAGEIALLTGAELRDPKDAKVEIFALSPISESSEGSLVFVAGKRAVKGLEETNAAVILCMPDVAKLVPSGPAVLISAKPQVAFAAVARLLFPSAMRPGPVTGEVAHSSQATIVSNAQIEEGVVIEAGAVIGKGVAIGQGTVIAPNAVIGASCKIGRDSYIGPGVTVQYAAIGDRAIVHAGVRIGQDGFGYLPGPAGLEKVPQIGRVIIQNDVEIGANTTIDRGALSDTVIGEGTKIDNLVQIAHNVRIGRGCIIAGHCGLSGSVTLGDYVMLGGRVGVADHINIGTGAQLAASSGVMNDVPAGERWAGSPAKAIRDAFRELAALRSLVENKRKKRDGDD